MAPLTFEEARKCVIDTVQATPISPPLEEVALLESAGRVLAQPVIADRDSPPLPRSVRDGFAVRAADLPGTLRVIGEVRAGQAYSGAVASGEAVEIMTGAPMPDGADAVVMVEHVSQSDGHVHTDRTLRSGENVNPRASESRQGQELLTPGVRIGYSEIALMAGVGCARVKVFTRPRVGILATGDEIVDIHETPEAHQIRNSNSYSLAAQVSAAGGIPVILPVARDEHASTLEQISKGFEHDLLLLSGGVSAGKYDIVEKVLAECGAEFFFDRVLIQPGQPLVFGRARNKFFFGLPGNPVSTMVTFTLFARAAVELLSGQTNPALPLLWTSLSHDFTQRTGLTRFLPARLNEDGSEVTPTGWQGSGDIGSVARANAFIVTEPQRERWPAGELIRVLPK